MPLTLHAGAEEVTFDALRAVPIPAATETHHPVAHHEIVDLMRFTLTYYGHEVIEEHHAIMPDGSRYFGLMTLRSAYGEYSDVIGLRNAHDRAFSIGVAFGSRVFVCDNTSFVGDHVIRRKHTPKAKRELPGLLAEIIAPLQLARAAQHQAMTTYQTTRLSDEMADHALMEMYRRGVLGLRSVGDLAMEWSMVNDITGPTAWSLFNFATRALTGKALEHPKLTSDLHGIMDRICEQVRVH